MKKIILLFLTIILLSSYCYADIWFNPLKRIQRVVYCEKIYPSSANCTLRKEAPVLNIPLFNDTRVYVNSSLFFQTGGGRPTDTEVNWKFGNIIFNLSSPINASLFVVNWSFSQYNGSVTGMKYFPLENVTANDVDCLNFTHTGLCNVSWNIPSGYDWQTYSFFGTGFETYQFNVVIIVNNVSGFNYGGRIGNTAILANDRSINFNETVNNSALYQASLANNWSCIESDETDTQKGTYYRYTCGLQGITPCIYNSKSETAIFDYNYGTRMASCGTNFGDKYSSTTTRYGSTIIYKGCNADYYSTSLGSSNSAAYSSNIIFLKANDSCMIRGSWGGLMCGSSATMNCTMVDTYIENSRQISLPRNIIGISGLRAYGFQVEYPGAILTDFKLYGGQYVVRTGAGLTSQSGNGAYIHRWDLSGGTTTGVNMYQSDRYNYSFYVVDGYWGTKADTNKVYWNIYSPSARNATVYELYSSIMTVTDNEGNPIYNATVNCTDGQNKTNFYGTTNEDGYATQDYGTITSYTTDDLTNINENWTRSGDIDQWTYREIYITNNASKGQRFVVKGNGTNTTLPLFPDWTINPTVNQTHYVIIPYLTVKSYVPISYTTNGYSNVTDYNPISCSVTKDGYKTVTQTRTITQFDRVGSWGFVMEEIPTWNYSIAPKWMIINSTGTGILKLSPTGDLSIAGKLYENTNSSPNYLQWFYPEDNPTIWLTRNGDLYIKGKKVW